MTFTRPDSLSTMYFSYLILFVSLAIPFGVFMADRRTGQKDLKRTLLITFTMSFWLGVFSLIVKSGILQRQMIPLLPLFLILSLVISIYFAFSKVGGWLVEGLPISALVFFQSFRLPLELILHSWVERGIIPSTMSWGWDGQNFDILSGILALLLFPIAAKFRKVAWFFNIVGFGLLINVIRVAIFSSPLPFAWNVTPPLLLIFHLPFAYIVPVCVGGALAGHIILTRALLKPKRE